MFSMKRLAMTMAVTMAVIWIWPQAGTADESTSAAAALRSEDSMPGTPFREGDVLTVDQVDKLQNYLPQPFWENREYFFFDGMKLEIGPAYREYGESEAYRNVTYQNRGNASIGPDGSLVGYTGGLPFGTDQIDCANDPEAGNKIIWNFSKAWNGDGSMGSFRYTSWDQGEQLPIYFEGTSKVVHLKDRVEPQYRNDPASPGDIFPGEKRAYVLGIEVDAPFNFRGLQSLTYRWDSAEGPRETADDDDIRMYSPTMRRVRQIKPQRICNMEGENITIDDLHSFGGILPQYEWACTGEVNVVAPFNTKHLAYPYNDDYNFGPYGLSYANDRWELRRAWVIRMVPKDDSHPYHHKDIYIDRETYAPLYSFAYDQNQQLWKIIWHNHRYSEDWDGTTPERTDTRSADGVWYKGWEGVEQPNDLRTVSDIVVSVKNGTGNRVEFWDSHGMPFATEGKLRRYIDVGRLSKGH